MLTFDVRLAGENMWETLLGGLLAILGGWGAVWFQQRYIRKNRMNEIIAERKVSANAQAYSYMKEIEGYFSQESSENTLCLLKSREEWFFNNRLFLPGKFPERWLTIRNELQKLVRREKNPSSNPEEVTKFQEHIDDYINRAIDEIFHDMNLKRINSSNSDLKK